MDDTQREIDRFAGYLNAIARTRLLFNTTEELVDYTGYKPAATSFGKYGGNHLFAKRAAFEALDAMRVKAVDPAYSLLVLLDEYEKASKYYSKFKRHRYFANNDDCYLALIEYYYADDHNISDTQLAYDIGEMEKDLVDESDSIVPILVLISLGIIPSYWNKKSCNADIEAEFEIMISFVMEMVAKSDVFSLQPVISRFRNQNDEDIPKTRFYLISCFETILLTLRQTSSPIRLSEGTRQLQFAYFDIEGVWRTDEKNEYWQFLRIDDKTFYAYRFYITDREVWLYDRYELMFLLDTNGIIACLSSSDVIEDIVKRGGVLPVHQSFMDFDFDDVDSPAQIAFIDIGVNGLDVACTLCKLKEKEANIVIDEHLSKSISIKADKDYLVFSAAIAITADYVFFPVPERKELYYRVPRIPEIHEIPLEELLVLTSKSLTVVGSPTNLVYYDVSSEEERKKHGIEITDNILAVS